jgi:ABC-type transport system substrate-binding protein
MAFSAPDALTLVKNGSYWGTPGRLETIRFTSATDPNTRLASLLSGGADVDIYVTPDQVNRLRSNRNYTLLTAPSARMYMVTLPMQMPEMQDIRVRQALNYAVDRNQLIKTVFGGLAKADDSSIPLGIGYQPIGVLPYDPQKAAALLREAGWTKGPNGVLQRNGQPFPAIHFEASNGHYPNDTALAPAVAGYLTAAGVPVKLYLDPFSTFFPTSAKVAAKEHWFVQMGWAAPGYDDAAFLYVIYGSQDIGGGNNWAGYSNPAIDALNVQIEKTVNPASRNALIARTARVVYRDLPAIYLMSAEWLVGAHQGLSGALVSPSEFHSFIHADWTK